MSRKKGKNQPIKADKAENLKLPLDNCTFMLYYGKKLNTPQT